MYRAPPTKSYNYDDTGYFSISVLEKVGKVELSLTTGAAGMGPYARALARRGYEAVCGPSRVRVLPLHLQAALRTGS